MHRECKYTIFYSIDCESLANIVHRELSLTSLLLERIPFEIYHSRLLKCAVSAQATADADMNTMKSVEQLSVI